MTARISHNVTASFLAAQVAQLACNRSFPCQWAYL